MTEQFVGIDVSKATLDLAVYETGEVWQVRHSEEGIAQTVQKLKELPARLIVLEATGGLEVSLVLALCREGLPVFVANPRHIRYFARALGKLAKTDRLDAHVLAEYAARVQPTPRPMPDAEQHAVRDLVTRRRQVVEMLTAERNRCSTARPKLREQIQPHIDWLEDELKRLNDEIHVLIQKNTLWSDRDDIIQSVPGIGPVCSMSLIAELPELGLLRHKAIAALVGLAPLNRDSGRHRGKRSIWGGRAMIRPVIYMGTLSAIQHNAVIRAFYDRLIKAGKAKKVAIVACAHKLLTILNAMVRHHTKWNAAYAQTAH
jgi:transposase